MINQTVLRKYCLLFVVPIVTSCAGNSGSSNTLTDNATKNGELKHTDKASNHSTKIEDPASLYFSGDISTEVQQRMASAFSLIQERLGKYPTEVYVLGTNQEEKDNLASVYCQNRENAGDIGLKSEYKNKQDCLSFINRPDHGFGHYLEKGLEAEVRGAKCTIGAGHNGQIQMNFHLLVWSKPMGYNDLQSPGYNCEFSLVFHEYWHVFQIAHTDPFICQGEGTEKNCRFDGQLQEKLLGGVWLQEGTAVYRQHTFQEEQFKIGNMQNSDTTLAQILHNKYISGQQAMQECPSISLENISYSDPCSQAAYDWGAWAAAYLAYKVGDPYIFENKYYPTLKLTKDEILAFESTFGYSRQEFFEEFNAWIYSPENERNKVIPIAQEGTGKLYYNFD